MVEIRKPIITVTGITGFIGSQVGFEVLKSKNYKLRGTTRDLNSDKIDALRNRVSGDANLVFKLNNTLSFRTGFNCTFEDKPIVPVTRFVYAITNGVQVNF